MSSNTRNIVITGFMATGKSTVAPLVADKLGRRFVETDAEIEQRTRMSIPDIFQLQGEAAFRQMERDLVHHLAAHDNLVIATGGGTLIDPDNRRILTEQAFVVCLNASLDELAARLNAQERAGRPLAQNWRAVLEQRREIYAALPHQIDTTDKSPEDIADEIVHRLHALTLDVKLPDGTQYPIHIQRGLLQELRGRAAAFGLNGRVMVVSNTTVAPLYGETLVQRLPDAELISVPDGESYKTLATVSALYDAFIEHGADRSTTVLALGGGVIGDMAGFAAASYMRGLPLVQMPTTLLAMVDASVGGKVGVDLPQGKNLVGAFKQPQAVLIDPDVLMTLTPQLWRAGMAEVIKHGLLMDEGLLDPALHAPQRAVELIARAVKVKIHHVERDPLEHGIRAHLNLGHTFAHALERVTDFAWAHGDAVGIGLRAAALLSHRLGLAQATLVTRVEALLTQVGLPQKLGDIDPNALWDAMHRDKKWRGGRSHFILLRDVGQPTSVTDVPRDEVLAVLKAIQT